MKSISELIHTVPDFTQRYFEKLAGEIDALVGSLSENETAVAVAILPDGENVDIEKN